MGLASAERRFELFAIADRSIGLALIFSVVTAAFIVTDRTAEVEIEVGTPKSAYGIYRA